MTNNRRLWIFVGAIAVSAFAFASAGAILFVPHLRSVVDAFQPLEAILAQLGATYGTILALVLTLSIIPIQRAAEVWSPSIIRLYRRDPVTYITFVALGVFCAASFLLAVRGLAGIPVSVVLAFSLATLGVSLDLLRWYHGHVCRLLDPTHAVRLSLQQVKETIDRMSSIVSRVSRLQHQLLTSEQKAEISVERIEATVYPQIAGYPNAINSWIDDLTEIAIKAVARGERLLAKTAISALHQLAAHFLAARKRNLTLTPAPEAMFLVATSDVGIVVDCVYEALQEVSQAAAAHNDESTAIRVSEAYQSIAIYSANLEAPAFREHTAPLTFTPIHYAFACATFAQSKGLDEIVYQTAGLLTKVSEAAPKDVADTDIHIPIIDGLCEIARYLYGKTSFGLAEEVNGHQFRILARMLHREDNYFNEILQHVLEKIEVLAPLAILNESLTGRLSVVSPLGKVYGLMYQNSLPNIFARAASLLPRIDSAREWINPYHELIDIAESVADHLHKIVETNDLGDSRLIFEIDQMIKSISIVVADIVAKPLRPDHDDETELIAKLLWVLAFYGSAFRGNGKCSQRRADDCCDSLVFIGLMFLERGHPEVLRRCISTIRSILEVYCEAAQPPNLYALGDLLAHLWGIRMVLVAVNNDALTREVDHALTTKPRALTSELWQDAQEAIGRRRQQLEERLRETDGGFLRPDSAEALLRKLLSEAQSG